MKYKTTCFDCTTETVGDAALDQLEADLTDDCAMEMTCARGHQHVVLFEAPRFEVLFDVGLHALQDGYYREAVSAFYVAFERACEHFVRSELTRLYIEEALASSTWKLMKKQSERQLGAFFALYLLRTKSTFPSIEALVSTRNSCVHQGTLPSRADAVKFGKETASLMLRILDALNTPPGDESGGPEAVLFVPPAPPDIRERRRAAEDRAARLGSGWRVIIALYSSMFSLMQDLDEPHGEGRIETLHQLFDAFVARPPDHFSRNPSAPQR